jgi:hypothetical protein
LVTASDKRARYSTEEKLSYFPRHTRELDLIEPPAFRRFTMSLVGMALVTGVLVRLVRAVAVSGPASGWIVLAVGVALAGLVLFGMTAMHLANFTTKKWVWRAPAFALVEASGEMVVSAALILFGKEPVGSGRAEMSQWFTLAGQTFLNRTVYICIFAALLAVVLLGMRRIFIAREPSSKAADNLRAELYSDASEPEIDGGHSS